MNLRVYSQQLTFDCDYNFRAVGGEDCFVEVVGGNTLVGAAVFRSSSEGDTDNCFSNFAFTRSVQNEHAQWPS